MKNIKQKLINKINELKEKQDYFDNECKNSKNSGLTLNWHTDTKNFHKNICPILIKELENILKD